MLHNLFQEWLKQRFKKDTKFVLWIYSRVFKCLESRVWRASDYHICLTEIFIIGRQEASASRHNGCAIEEPNHSVQYCCDVRGVAKGGHYLAMTLISVCCSVFPGILTKAACFYCQNSCIIKCILAKEACFYCQNWF